MQLKGKTALVTGASRGIGEAAARELAKAGAKVVCFARGDCSELARDIGGRAVKGDVTDYAALASASEGVDILVNNAGLLEPIARIEDSDPSDWAKVIDVNVTGAYNAIRATLPGMKAKGGGTVINISSGAATGPMEGWSHYCASKAALLMLTRALDKEERGNGIRAIGLSPGTVATNMQVAIKASGINPVSQLDPSVHIPPAWVGKAIVWLCSDAGNPWLGADVSLRLDEVRDALGLPRNG